MRSRKIDRNWIAIKLDLEKAYDRISWDFIDVTLVVAGVFEFLRKVIMSAISSSSMQILGNGVSSQSFKPVRGIRQGCHLSPYLFVLCMEWLGHSIRSEISAEKWRLIQLSRFGSFLSHLFFVDDLVIFGKTEMDQAILLKEILKSFSDFFDHKVNAGKSNMYFSKGVDDSLWQVTLAQSVLLAIPNYFMQTVLVPKGVCDEIEKIARQFIWGSSMGHSKCALVGWESICKPRCRVGLGLRHLYDQNNSFLMKIAFNLISQKDALWVRVLRSKYGWKNHIPYSIHKTNCSHISYSLSKVWPLLLHSSLNFECNLRDWVLPDGTLNLDLVRLWLSEDIVIHIVSIRPPHPGGGIDRIIWARSGSGSFSI
ncbi:uncharacterized protein [Gossypium hirsutum]|uniref:Reverse transcriptase domain-containing protein n=1 Tax=Gossypium hirsutum TaxID=3635 RepID=A0A1U8HVM5_GOSHI|nr:uncharacterized protein LOC107890071 [Gossypium hirsutum]